MSDNPIVAALDKLSAQWEAFVREEDARVLVWQATHDERALVDAFVARERSARAAQTQDVFLPFVSPFVARDAYGDALCRELIAQYEGLAASFGEPERATRWHAPEAKRGTSDVTRLVEVLTSFRAHHVPKGSPARLAVWLQPAEVEDEASYLHWLLQLVHEAPTELRFLVLDHAAVFVALAEAEPKRVQCTRCQLGFAQALESLAESVPQKTPGDVFRVLQTKLAVAVQANDLGSAELLAARATELSTAQGWPQLTAGIQMMLAAAYNNADRPFEAIAAYARAEDQMRSCEAAPTDDAAEPAGSNSKAARRVRMSAVFGRATTMLKVAAYPQAADAYLEGAALAHAIEEARLELDGYRLAAFSYELAGDIAKAWQMGKHALSFAFGLAPELQKTSNLPYLAQQQLRIARTQRDYADYRAPLEDEFQRRLGPRWEDALTSAVQSQ